VAIFEPEPHPRIEQRKLEAPAHIADTVGPGFNERLGLRITKRVGTMTCAYVFAIIALISLPAAISTRSLIIIVAWVAQTFLQLVLLSIIMVGQQVSGAAADARADQTFKDAEAILHESQQIQAHLLAQDDVLMKLITHVDAI
jgi:hypothetical protein